MSTETPSVQFLHELAVMAERSTLEGYLKPHCINISSKPKDGFRFDPVTNIDHQTEILLRIIIAERFPEHAIMGEEFGESGENTFKWVIDPIDGTRP